MPTIHNMIDKNELNQILAFVAKRWTDLSRDPDNKALKSLPAGKGRWVTTIMYTDNEDEANKFKDVLLRWQSKPQQPKSPDLIHINETKENSESEN